MSRQPLIVPQFNRSKLLKLAHTNWDDMAKDSEGNMIDQKAEFITYEVPTQTTWLKGFTLFRHGHRGYLSIYVEIKDCIPGSIVKRSLKIWNVDVNFEDGSPGFSVFFRKDVGNMARFIYDTSQFTETKYKSLLENFIIWGSSPQEVDYTPTLTWV